MKSLKLSIADLMNARFGSTSADKIGVINLSADGSHYTQVTI
jgi:hypothetical protein